VITQRISVKSSVLISIAVCLVHLAAGVVLWLVPIPVVGQAVLSFAIAFSLIFFMARDAGLHAANSIVALELRDSGEIALQLLKGEWFDCELLGSSFVSPQMTVINLLPRGRRFSRRLILVPDNVDPRDFRRLRIWLRWKGGEDVSAVQLVDPR
jgi:toxin CptA